MTPKNQIHQWSCAASKDTLVTLGNDWLWVAAGYVMPLPTITIRHGKRSHRGRHRCDCRQCRHSGWRPEGPMGRPCAVAYGRHPIMFSGHHALLGYTRYRTGSTLLTPIERKRPAFNRFTERRIITGNESPRHDRHS